MILPVIRLSHENDSMVKRRNAPSWEIFISLVLYLQLAPGIMLCGSLSQDSLRNLGAARETGPVSHLSGDIPRPQGPGLSPRLLPRVHPATATAAAEGPGGGVSSVPQCHCCGRQ